MQDETATLTDEQSDYAEIHRVLYNFWRFGSNALVGWRPTRLGIEIVTVPKVRLFLADHPHSRTFSGSRQLGDQVFDAVARELEVQPVEVRLERPIGNQPGMADPLRVEELFSVFAVTKTNYRAVLLIDIVGFSLSTPEEQGAKLATLEFALNIAEATVRQRGLEVEFARTTTGDGFYVWNRLKGFAEDIDFFAAFVFFLIFYSAIRRTTRTAAATPELRLCMGIGSHFHYTQPRASGGSAGEFIVGDVTIQVARLIGAARSGQILISDFQRPLDGEGAACSTEDFLAAVAERLETIGELRVLGSRIERFGLYLTGPRDETGSFHPNPITVTDKHGLEHRCFNAKLNAFPEGAEPFYCGLQHADLVSGGEKD